MIKSNRFFGLIILAALFGCQSNSSNDMSYPETAGRDMAFVKMAEEEAAPASGGDQVQEVERKLIRNGRVEFETENIGASRQTIFQAVDKYKGYVSSDQEYKSPGRVSNTIVIRVPAKDFDSFLADATAGVDKFDSKEINVTDVTEEFLDIQARLKTKKELEARYLELLKMAKTVTEMLEIERQSGELRAEIESIEGRLKYLEDQVSLSTLTITFYEVIPDRVEFERKFKNGFANGWDNLIWFFVFLTNIWPFILIFFGLIVAIRIYRRRKR